MAYRFSLISSPITKPILDGAVRPQGVELELSSANVDDNSRGMLAGQFDVAEMSIGTYVQARALGGDFVALPVFPARRFMQPCIFFRAGTIAKPEDLRGKRIAVPQFWMTSSVWHRGLMEHEYGVRSTEVSFVTTNDERVEAGFTPGVTVTQIMNRPLPEFFTLFPSLIAERKADVIFAPRYPEQTGGLDTLFPDHLAASLAYHRRTGVYPLMHTVVAKGSAVRESPALAEAVVDLYTRAKEHAYSSGAAIESPLVGVPFAEARELLGGDPYPFGVERNRPAIDAFLEYAAEQGLSSRRLTVDEAFAPVA